MRVGAKVGSCMLLLALSLAPSPPATAAGGAADVERLLAEWRVGDAEGALRQLQGAGQRGPQVQVLEALVLFHRSDYEAAAERLQGALQRMNNAPRKLRSLLQLITSTAETVRGYTEHRSAGGNFLFKVPPGKDELLVTFAGETLEAMRQRLADDLGYAPPDPIRVEIYPQPSDLARVSTLTTADIERTGTVALCKYNRLMIVSPRALLRGYGWRDTLAHEYVHLIISRLSHNNAPIWLQEGLAKFFEARWRHGPEKQAPLTPGQEHLLAAALRRNKLIRWSDMHPSMAKLPSQKAAALAFAQVQTAIGFIAERQRLEGLRRLLVALRSGKSDWAAVQQVTGLSPQHWRQAYRRHLRGLNLRRLPGMVQQRLRFGKSPSKERELAQIREEQARRHFRLADMLRQRKLLRAAILEYDKARNLIGDRDPVVANALARTYLEVGNPEQSIRTMLPVLQYYPELAGPQVTLGTAYLRTGDRRAAAQHLRIALRINPFDPEIHCGLSKVVQDKGAARRYADLCSKLGGAAAATDQGLVTEQLDR